MLVESTFLGVSISGYDQNRWQRETLVKFNSLQKQVWISGSVFIKNVAVVEISSWCLTNPHTPDQKVKGEDYNY